LVAGVLAVAKTSRGRRSRGGRIVPESVAGTAG